MILASASPRRRELLALAGFEFTVETAQVEESYDSLLTPDKIVEHLALIKAQAVAQNHPREVVIGADTVVAVGGSVLGKPKNEADAAQMLRRLSGREHEVYTGVCIAVNGKTQVFNVCTVVKFRELTDEQIAAYIATGEPMDKAGAYGIQGRGCVLVESISGDYFNVVGLPVSELYSRLHKQGQF